jgi:hypothetical protein
VVAKFFKQTTKAVLAIGIHHRHLRDTSENDDRGRREPGDIGEYSWPWAMFSGYLWTGEMNGIGEVTDLNEKAGIIESINDLRFVFCTGIGKGGEGRVINGR